MNTKYKLDATVCILTSNERKMLKSKAFFIVLTKEYYGRSLLIEFFYIQLIIDLITINKGTEND